MKQLLGVLLLVTVGCGAGEQSETPVAVIADGAKSNGVVEAALPAQSLAPATNADASVNLETLPSVVPTALRTDGDVADVAVFSAPLFNKKVNHSE